MYLQWIQPGIPPLLKHQPVMAEITPVHFGALQCGTHLSSHPQQKKKQDQF